MSKDKKKVKKISHWAASPEDCEEMVRRNLGLNLLKAVSDDSDSILNTECKFEETSSAVRQLIKLRTVNAKRQEEGK